MPRINIKEDWTEIDKLVYEFNINDENMNKKNKGDNGLIGAKRNRIQIDAAPVDTIDLSDYQPGVSTIHNQKYNCDGYRLLDENNQQNIDCFPDYNPDDYT